MYNSIYSREDADALVEIMKGWSEPGRELTETERYLNND